MFRTADAQPAARTGETQPAAPSRDETPTAKSSPATGAAVARVPESNAWLPAGMRVKGQITGDEDLLIDGEVEGPISIGQHRLIIGREAKITGSLAAREIVIYGKVDGDRSVGSEKIDIKKNASVTGHLTTRHIVIEDGASFRGSIDIGDGKQQAEAKLAGAKTPAQTETMAEQPVARAASA